jgi:hypothetical protein
MGGGLEPALSVRGHFGGLCGLILMHGLGLLVGLVTVWGVVSLLKLLERGLVFSDEDQVAERLGQLAEGQYLVGFSARGVIELRRVSESAYTIEFYDLKSRISHVMKHPVRLPAVPLALRVVLDDARGGRVGEYEFAVFKCVTPSGGGGAPCLR